MPGATVSSTVDLADAVVTGDAVLHASIEPGG
jgi:hypothetical protein